MHPPPNDRPTGKKESDSEKNHADFGQKGVLPFFWRKKAAFKKAKHGAHYQLQNNREKNEIPKLLPSGSTRKRRVFFKSLDEVVHLLYVNFVRRLAREPFLQLPPSTCPLLPTLKSSSRRDSNSVPDRLARLRGCVSTQVIQPGGDPAKIMGGCQGTNSSAKRIPASGRVE